MVTVNFPFVKCIKSQNLLEKKKTSKLQPLLRQESDRLKAKGYAFFMKIPFSIYYWYMGIIHTKGLLTPYWDTD